MDNEILPLHPSSDEKEFRNQIANDKTNSEESFCFKDEYAKFENKSKTLQYCRALHAEENAILQTAKIGGIGLKNATIYTTTFPCELCAKKIYQVGYSPHSLALEDFNLDGNKDIAGLLSSPRNSDGRFFFILYGDSEGNFPKLVKYKLSSNPSDLAVGDFNSDNIPDIAISVFGGNFIELWYGDGRESFQGPFRIATGKGTNSLTALDCNADGRTDLAVANYHEDYLSVLIRKPSGGFYPPKNYSVGYWVYKVETDDVNLDGLPLSLIHI